MEGWAGKSGLRERLERGRGWKKGLESRSEPGGDYRMIPERGTRERRVWKGGLERGGSGRRG